MHTYVMAMAIGEQEVASANFLQIMHDLKLL